MSIDPLKAFGTVIPISKGHGNNKAAEPSARSFDDLLKTAESLPPRRDEAVAQAKTIAHLAQLKMMQGLLLADDETEGESSLSGLFDWKSSAALLPKSGQKIDNLYARMQPTLQEPAASGRNEIERLIDRVAGQVSLAPELIRSVVAAESDFQPDAVSPVGAQGLMQLMPETAQELGVKDSFDPQQNLLGGSRYLKQLLDKYDGDLDRALAAYNWGQGNVDRHGLEQMPQETREYLARVKRGLEGTRS